MKKLIFVFVFALLGTYFQSAQAQTFSRVVTVGIDTTLGFGNMGYSDILYTVPPNKIFKISYLVFDFRYYYNQSNCPSCSTFEGKISNPITINNFSVGGNFLAQYKNQEVIWLKSGDVLKYNPISTHQPPTYQTQNFIIKLFLSGIEYDAQ